MPAKKSPGASYGYTVFCDDIRQELGNKTSFMGVYVADLTIDAPFPAVLAKLCMSIFFYLDRTKIPRSLAIKASFQSTGEERSISATTVDIKAIKNMPIAPDDSFILLRSDIALVPFQLASEGEIVVVAQIDENAMRVGSLRIRQQPTS